MKKGSEHTKLKGASNGGQDEENVMNYSKGLRSSGQEVQKPVIDGGPKSNIQKIRDEFIWYYDVDL